MRPSYDGPWNHQWVRLDDFVVALERRRRRRTVWHRFLCNLVVFFLAVLYGSLALAPETRTALAKAARQSFVDVPFEVRQQSAIHHLRTLNAGEIVLHSKSRAPAAPKRVQHDDAGSNPCS